MLLDKLDSLVSVDKIKEQSDIVRANKNELDDFWIFGAGNNGRQISKALKKTGKNVIGFIDDTPEKRGQKTDDGIKIFNFEDFKTKLSPADNVVISILNGRSKFQSLSQKFEGLRLNRVICAHEISCICDEEFYFIERLSNVEKNVPKYRKLYESLPDNISRQALLDYLNLKIYFKFYDRIHKFFQPLESALQFHNNVVFYDAGAYDGDTVILFHDLFKNKINRIIAFEPDSANYNNLLKNLLDKKIDALSLNVAVSDEIKILRFNAAGNTGSAVNIEGDTLAQALSLDSLSFPLPKNSKLIIKMDIEGFEANAIRGMQRTLQAEKPILAISVYHKPNDLIEIIDGILDAHEGYQVFLRFHAYDGADLTAYFV